MNVIEIKTFSYAFQNIHLVNNWLPELDKKIEITFENAHENYRLFMSAESTAFSQFHSIPQVSILVSRLCSILLIKKKFYQHWFLSIGNSPVIDKNYQRTTHRNFSKFT